MSEINFPVFTKCVFAVCASVGNNSYVYAGVCKCFCVTTQELLWNVCCSFDINVTCCYFVTIKYISTAQVNGCRFVNDLLDLVENIVWWKRFLQRWNLLFKLIKEEGFFFVFQEPKFQLIKIFLFCIFLKFVNTNVYVFK